jgi:hypothetical protein
MSLWDDAAPIHRNIGDLNTLASLLNNGWDEPAAGFKEIGDGDDARR